jgi:hypothetical protein
VCTTAPRFFLLKWGLTNFLPGLASNRNPPNPSLPSSYYYRLEPLVLVLNCNFDVKVLSLLKPPHYSFCNFSPCSHGLTLRDRFQFQPSLDDKDNKVELTNLCKGRGVGRAHRDVSCGRSTALFHPLSCIPHLGPLRAHQPHHLDPCTSSM